MAKRLTLTLTSFGTVALLAALLVVLGSATRPTARAASEVAAGSGGDLQARVALSNAAPQQITETFEVIASGLDNPRDLVFGPDGNLYVTEAGNGGEEPCFPGPEGGEVCYGTSGAVTRVSGGTQERIVTGLSSIAGLDGSNATGPHNISFGPDGTLYVLVGLGADPAILEPGGTLELLGDDLGQLITATESGMWQPIVDVAGYEADHNPINDPDSNPFGLLTHPDGSHVVADAGANDLLHIDVSGTITTLAVFPDRDVLAPPFLGLPPGTMIPMQAVPTAVTMGADGAYYVGQLTGFPFPVGGANIYRVVSGEITATVFLTGFTNIVDLEFGADGSLYVLEMAKNGLLSGDPTGAIIRVAPDGTRQEIASDGLVAPAKMTVGPDHALYVSNFGVFSGMGQVVRVSTPLSENTIFLPIVARMSAP